MPPAGLRNRPGNAKFMDTDRWLDLMAAYCVHLCPHLQATSRVYHAATVDPAPLRNQANEVVEALSCYFPVRFTPPKNDTRGITRQQV